MTKPIDFYFDFSSPYAYLMARDLTHLAQRQGRDLVWRPILLGAIFKQTGRTPPIDGSARGEYLRHDIERTARRKGLRLNWPAEFPFSSVAAARAIYWLNRSSPKRAQHLAAALMDAIWIEGRALNDPDVLNEVAGRLDVDVEAMNQAVQDPEIKALLKQEMDHAMSQNVFGSPWVVVDGEPFWGNDRLDDIQHWLQTGGF